jgi:hypothetical protein
MMSQSEAAKFYRHLKSFLKDLILVFPEDRDIKLISSALNIATMDDPDYKIISQFYEALIPFAHLIDTRDDDFFYTQSAHIVMHHKHQYQLFNKLNIYWETLNDTNRKIVWDYFQILFSISKHFTPRG